MKVSMLTKYRIMRGLFKRRLVRIAVWKVVKFFNRGALKAFLNQQFERRGESFTSFEAEAIHSIVAGLERDGALYGPCLPAETVNYLNAYAETHPCFAYRDPAKGFFLKDKAKAEARLGKSLLLAQYFNAELDSRINRLAHDPFLLAVAAQYLGVAPKLMSVNMWWTFPVEASAEDKAKHAHVFHFDLDDRKCVKFFFYLTDVGSEDMPHVYVRTSNRLIKYKNTLLRSKRFTDSEIVDAYGTENVVEVVGPANTCLIEDTITVHKGITPVRNPRLILQFEYSINTYPEISCVTDKRSQQIFV
jgi:hypothetical protein